MIGVRCTLMSSGVSPKLKHIKTFVKHASGNISGALRVLILVVTEKGPG